MCQDLTLTVQGHGARIIQQYYLYAPLPMCYTLTLTPPIRALLLCKTKTEDHIVISRLRFDFLDFLFYPCFPSLPITQTRTHPVLLTHPSALYLPQIIHVIIPHKPLMRHSVRYAYLLSLRLISPLASYFLPFHLILYSLVYVLGLILPLLLVLPFPPNLLPFNLNTLPLHLLGFVMSRVVSLVIGAVHRRIKLISVVEQALHLISRRNPGRILILTVPVISNDRIIRTGLALHVKNIVVVSVDPLVQIVSSLRHCHVLNRLHIFIQQQIVMRLIDPHHILMPLAVVSNSREAFDCRQLTGTCTFQAFRNLYILI